MNKPPTTYSTQLQKLKERGCEILDEAFCHQVLKKINYYRLSAYLLPYKQSNGTYVAGTSFDKVFSIYEFDRKMRGILLSAVEEVEISFRAEIAYIHAHKYGTLGYMDAINYNDRHNHQRFCEHFAREISQNSTTLFVKHHKSKYDGDFPIWVAVELFTFGMLSRFYSDMKTEEQNAIAGSLSTSVANVKSWLYCCSSLRNICAHYGRLYFRTFTAVPANRNLPILPYDSAPDKLFGAIYALRGLFPDKERWRNEILISLSNLVTDYGDVIELNHIGFPRNWKNILG